MATVKILIVTGGGVVDNIYSTHPDVNVYLHDKDEENGLTRSRLCYSFCEGNIDLPIGDLAQMDPEWPDRFRELIEQPIATTPGGVVKKLLDEKRIRPCEEESEVNHIDCEMCRGTGYIDMNAYTGPKTKLVCDICGAEWEGIDPSESEWEPEVWLGEHQLGCCCRSCADVYCFVDPEDHVPVVDLSKVDLSNTPKLRHFIENTFRK